MFQSHLIDSERKLNIPIYSLSEKKTSAKSCFIDNNRIDTVKSAKAVETKKQNELTSPCKTEYNLFNKGGGD